MKKQLITFVVCNMLLLHIAQIWACFGGDTDAPKKTGLSFMSKKN
jgi:hypothetical protein